MYRHVKQPFSVLVIVYTPERKVLLLERSDFCGFWQSVTGSIESGESFTDTAVRELHEETGLNASLDGVLTDLKHEVRYEIYPQWRHRYSPNTTHNIEHWFSFRVPQICSIALERREHNRYLWLPAINAAEKAFSPSNREAILSLFERVTDCD
ncbi:MAG: dihydroneopterin triphosphate diphosphatase [Burkholderiales bacterium]|nr:dihydroneopterin triphosphate diphosphatase [Burkholderiales bacterium]